MHAEIRAQLLYLPEYLLLEPLRVLRAWLAVRRFDTYRAARTQWWKDLRRDRTLNRVRRFGQGLVLAAELPADVKHLHAHFLHTPASVARYAATLLGLPWSGSAHAKDIWTTPQWEKREKLAGCDWLVTCTRANVEHLAPLCAPGKVELVYHGLDLARFPANKAPRAGRDGSDGGNPVKILSVSRLVEKKGVDVLLAALARLPRSLHWRLVHVGGGPLAYQMDSLCKKLGIADRVEWRGALAQDEVLREYRAADLFALASRVARDGDRDGLPNVLVEAQSQGLACVASRISAVPELVTDGLTGVLVAPDDAGALAKALEDLIRDPARRRSIGEAAAARVRAEFTLEGNFSRLARKFGLAPHEDRVLRSA